MHLLMNFIKVDSSWCISLTYFISNFATLAIFSKIALFANYRKPPAEKVRKIMSNGLFQYFMPQIICLK